MLGLEHAHCELFGVAFADACKHRTVEDKEQKTLSYLNSLKINGE